MEILLLERSQVMSHKEQHIDYVLLTLFATIIVCCCSLVLNIATTHAKPSSDQFSFGGITRDASLEYIMSIYGEPSERISGDTWMTYKYGDDGSFSIDFIYDKNFIDRCKGGGSPYWHCTEIRVTADNGISTPAGVAVGMSKQELINIYGEPNTVSAKNTIGWMGKIRKDGIYYDEVCYYSDLYLIYSSHYYKHMAFFMNRGKIVAMLLTVWI